MGSLSKDTIREVHSGKFKLNAKRERCYNTVDNIDYLEQPVSYEHFFLNYLAPNRYFDNLYLVLVDCLYDKPVNKLRGVTELLKGRAEYQT